MNISNFLEQNESLFAYAYTCEEETSSEEEDDHCPQCLQDTYFLFFSESSYICKSCGYSKYTMTYIDNKEPCVKKAHYKKTIYFRKVLEKLNIDPNTAKTLIKKFEIKDIRQRINYKKLIVEMLNATD